MLSAMLACPGTSEQAFENVPFLSLVVHLEEHLFFGILKMQWANSQTFQVYVAGRGICNGAYEKIQSFMARIALYTSQSHIVFQIVRLYSKKWEF